MGCLTRRGLLGLFAAAPAPAAVSRMTCRRGPSGERVSLLGYGAMRLPTVDGRHANGWAEGSSNAPLDERAIAEQIDYAIANGVNYFDTAPVYCRGESEAAMGKTLSRHPRDRYFLATKLSNFAERDWPLACSQALFERSLRNLRTDYVDFYLLHAVGNGGFETFERRYVKTGIIPWLFEQKAKGRIRHLGWSFHGDRRALDWLFARHDAGEYRWDFAQIQLNYLDWRHATELNARNLDAAYLYDELKRRNLPVVVMEPLLGGGLARFDESAQEVLSPLDPEATPAKWAFRFCGSFPRVLTVLSGMTRFEHLKENIKTFSPLKPLSDGEFAALERAASLRFAAGLVPCTRCRYCMPCPYGIDIPAILAFRNEWLSHPGKHAAGEVLAAYRRRVPEPLRRAEHCTGCGRCRGACPQQIDIPSEIAAIDRAVEALKDGEVRR